MVRVKLTAMETNPFGSVKARGRLLSWVSSVLIFLAVGSALMASEDAPMRPFAQLADVPGQGKWVVGALYEQSEAYYVWAGNRRANITVHTPDGETYGIDIRQGYLTVDYGLTEKWAADVNIGATTVGWRSFDPNAGIQKTTGVMDPAFGVRYQIFNEAQEASSPWTPTLTFRAGAIVPGSYNRGIAFSPGNHSVAIEPSILFRKRFGWPGLGVWGDALYRWMHTNGNDQYMLGIGLFQEIKGWELDAGFQHLEATSGEDIVFVGSHAPYEGIDYKTDVPDI